MAVSAYDKANLSTAQQAEIDRVTKAAESGSMSWADAHTAAEAVRASGGYSGGRYGDEYNAYDYASGTKTTAAATTTDLSDYLKDMYAAQTESSLAALKSAYDQNAAGLKSEAAKIPQTYYAAKNDAASQSELQKQAFNEYAATRGLNTGTSGQAALASSSALQSNLANINTQQANALSDNALEQQKLAAQYSAAVNQAEASGNSALASALYQEYTRQVEAATTAKQNAQAQSNWEKEYQLSVNQNTANAESESRQYAYNLAMSMLEAGVMPDSATLAAAGISASNATAIKNAALAAATAKAASSSRSSSSSKSSKSSSSSSKRSTGLTAAQAQSAIKSGTYTSSTISAYDQYYGDGAFMSYLKNSDSYVNDMTGRIADLSSARKLAAIKQYYDKGYYNSTVYAYLLDYYGLA